ncbi:MAG: response regulator [Mariniphaga sp.]|nr:response regulator [Mariniphaga sp.]
MTLSITNQNLLASKNCQDGYVEKSFAEECPLNILIAEDNIVNQKLIERILRKLGYQTDTASDGIQVLNFIVRKEYHVILMDVRMPEMDGLEATHAIRQMGIKQPYIIAMTANAMSKDREECLENGMNDYMSKPLSTDMIINSLKKGYTYFTQKI